MSVDNSASCSSNPSDMLKQQQGSSSNGSQAKANPKEDSCCSSADDVYASLKKDIAEIQSTIKELQRDSRPVAADAKAPAKKTIIDEINELNAEYNELSTKAEVIQKQRLEIVERLLPKQLGFFKGVIENLQVENRQLNEKLASMERAVDSDRLQNVAVTTPMQGQLNR